jgi:HAD superfamily hydrolase (TIGR01484 family)
MTAAGTAAPKPPAQCISLMVSDVDGTLVNRDKQLAPATVEAVRRLRAAGVPFAAVSSRPPRGMRILVEPLALELFGGFNGGAIVRADFTPVEEHFVAPDAARTGIEVMKARGAYIWVFADNEWYITDPENSYVAREIRTVAFQPTLVSDFGDHVARAGKIVGSSSDFAMLAACEAELQGLVGNGASARRSQDYYLDLTPPGTDKGETKPLPALWSDRAGFEKADADVVAATESLVAAAQANDAAAFATALPHSSRRAGS